MSTSSPPEFDLSRLRGIPDPILDDAREALESPALPGSVATRLTRVARQRAALAFGIVWIVGLAVFFGARPDLSEVPLAYLSALVIAPLAGAGIAVALAMAPGKFGLGVRPGLLTCVALGLPVGLVLAGLLLSPAHASGDRGTFVQGVRCCSLMLLWAVLPMAAGAIVLRRWFVVRAGLRSALVGVAAGSSTAAVMNLHCAVTGVWHVAIGHSLAVVLAGVAGAWVLARGTRV